MGINCFGSRWSGDFTSPAKSGNPDPQNFKIIKTMTIGDNTLAFINFPDCMNCDGNKILLIGGITAKELRELKKIDPHFSEDIIEPFVIARFHPSESGWDYGIHMMKWLKDKI